MADEGDWKFASSDEMTLTQYPCGVCAGSQLQLRMDLHIRDHKGRPTGEVFIAGSVWTVLTGNPDEREVIWLRDPSGDQQTWDDSDLLASFEQV
jgi:hypothetical protein